MKQILITTIAAVMVVGCGKAQPTTKAPDILIYDAAKDGNIKAVKQHLAAGTDVNTKGGSFGGTPLHSAAIEGHKEVAELLIAKGADVNAKRDDGWTPLMDAAQEGYMEIVELLRKHGGKTYAELKAEGK